MNNIIINFPKDKTVAQIIQKGNKDSLVELKKSIYSQLVSYIENKSLKFNVKKLIGTKIADGYSFVMENEDNKIVINFEDIQDEYYKLFNDVYLQIKINEQQKENKIKNFKTFGKIAVSSLLVGSLLTTYGMWLKYNDMKTKMIMEEMNQIIEGSNHTIKPETAYQMALKNLGVAVDNNLKGNKSGEDKKETIESTGETVEDYYSRFMMENPDDEHVRHVYDNYQRYVNGEEVGRTK